MSTPRKRYLHQSTSPGKGFSNKACLCWLCSGKPRRSHKGMKPSNVRKPQVFKRQP